MDASDIIKILRQQHHLTQNDLAKLLGVQKSSIQKYESGAVSNLKMETIRTICKEFAISPYVLVFPEHISSEDIALRMRISEEEMRHVFALNMDGLRKVLDYAKDLDDSGNYKQGDDNNG